MKMISKMSNLKKSIFTIGCAIGLSLLSITKSEARYNALYFDAKFDMTQHRLVIDVKSYDSSGYNAPEDKLIVDGALDLSNEQMSIKKVSRSDSKYYHAMKPDNGNKPYKNTGKDSLDPLLKKFDPNRTNAATNASTSKKNTVPNGIYQYTSDGNVYTHEGITKDSDRGKTLISAISGIEDREEKGVSMVVGFNALLEKIGILRGGYTNETFRETVKGLTWLIHHGVAGDKLEFEVKAAAKVDNSLEEAETNDEGDNTDDPDGEDFIGDGTNITVKINSVGAHKKQVQIIQSNKIVGSVWQIYKLDTGYRASNLNEDGSATINIVGTGMGDTNRVYSAPPQDNLRGLATRDIAYIQLYDLVFEAFVKLDSGIVSSGSADDPLTNTVIKMTDNMMTMIENQIGLTRMEDLVYNLSGREYKTYEDGYELGMYPETWKGLINQCLTIVTTLSVLFLMFAILRILFLMNLDSMNVSTRLNVKQDIANIIYSVFGLMLFPTVFYVLGLFNYKITTLLFNSLANPDIDFFVSFAADSGTIGGIIMRMLMFGVKIYLNVMYIMRSLNISLLLILAPIFIIGTAFVGPERIKTFIRELVGNIFLQSFHAIIIWFIIEAKASMGVGGLDEGGIFISVAMATAIIPVTEMFREMVFGDSKSLSSAGRIAGQTKNTLYGLGHKAMDFGAGVAKFGINGYRMGRAGKDRINMDKLRQYEEKMKNRQQGNELDIDIKTGDKDGKNTTTVGGDGKNTTKTKDVDIDGKKVANTVGGTVEDALEKKAEEALGNTVEKEVKEAMGDAVGGTLGKKTLGKIGSRIADKGGKLLKRTAGRAAMAAADGPLPILDAANAVLTAGDVINTGVEIVTGESIGGHLSNLKDKLTGDDGPSELFDNSLAEGFGRGETVKQQISNGINNTINLANALKSGNPRAMDYYFDRKESGAKTVDYMKANSKNAHKDK